MVSEDPVGTVHAGLYSTLPAQETLPCTHGLDTSTPTLRRWEQPQAASVCL